MSTSLAEAYTPAVNELLDELEQYPEKAASALRECMESATEEQYKHFLNMMYHYTSGSEQKLKEAAQNADTEELKDFFEHMAKEERGHHKLAEVDLEAYGETISQETPKEVAEFNAFWKSLAHEHGSAYLGALYVFENIAKHITQEIRDFLQRLECTKKQSRWLSVHAEADLEHGKEVHDMLEKYIEDNFETIKTAAQQACQHWIAINQAGFSGTKAS